MVPVLAPLVLLLPVDSQGLALLLLRVWQCSGNQCRLGFPCSSLVTTGLTADGSITLRRVTAEDPHSSVADVGRLPVAPCPDDSNDRQEQKHET